MISKRTIPELLKFRAFECPEAIAHWIPDADGNWFPVSFGDFYREVVNLARLLKTHGVEKGQVAAIMSATVREWELLHHAVLALGGVVVGIDPSEISEHLDSIIKTAGVRTLFVDRVDRLDKFSAETLARLGSVVCFSAYPLQERTAHAFRSAVVFLELPSATAMQDDNSPLPDIAIPEDAATIIFTSGTTGAPKGIAYRHEQITAAVDAIMVKYPELATLPCRLPCWLPLSNLFQRIVNLCAIAGGAEIYFVDQPQKIIQLLPRISPHIFIAVPRFYEKLYQGFEDKLEEQSKVLVFILRACLRAGESDSPVGSLFKRLNLRLFKPFRAIFGNDIRYMVSGSAPMPLWLLKRFHSMGLLILEAYGMSENAVPVAANSVLDYRFGAVGRALPGNTVVLAEDGELLVKGIGVFSGYLGEGRNNRSLNDNGFLASGDFAEMDEQGFIRLTGRKSEVFKTSTGRKIAPVEIEAPLLGLSMVEHAVVFGESRKFLVALLVLGRQAESSEEEMLSLARKIRQLLPGVLTDLPAYKQPAGIVLLFDSLAVERQELTSNMKIRRKIIDQHYGKWINALYNALGESDSAIQDGPVRIEPSVVLFKTLANIHLEP